MEDGSPEQSTDIQLPDEQSSYIPPPDKRSDIHPLTEQCALNRSIAIWSAQKFPSYLSNHALLRTFRTWPHGVNPSPDSLGAAGFYYMVRTHLANFRSLS